MKKGTLYNSDKPYDNFFNLFKIITDRFAAIKQCSIYGKRTQKIYHG